MNSIALTPKTSFHCSKMSGTTSCRPNKTAWPWHEVTRLQVDGYFLFENLSFIPCDVAFRGGHRGSHGWSGRYQCSHMRPDSPLHFSLLCSNYFLLMSGLFWPWKATLFTPCFMAACVNGEKSPACPMWSPRRFASWLGGNNTNFLKKDLWCSLNWSRNFESLLLCWFECHAVHRLIDWLFHGSIDALTVCLFLRLIDWLMGFYAENVRLGTINILRKGLEGGWWVPKILRYIVQRGRGPWYLSYGGWVVILAA